VSAAKEVEEMQGLTEGRIVRYVLSEADCPKCPESIGQNRPAIIVRVADRARAAVNLTVFVDGVAESQYEGRDTIRRAGVAYDEKESLGTWHWPPRS